MKIEYVKPFIGSVESLFTTMLSSSCEKGNIGVSTAKKSPHEITALIGLSGEAKGTVELSFPTTTALTMVSKMLMIESKELDSTTIDGVGEIVNIVAGSAKSKFVRGEGKPIDLSLPNVIMGDDYTVEYPSGTTWIEVPFKSELGPFNLRVTFEKAPE